MERKSKTASWLLAFFLGTTGAHRYYLGYVKQGVAQSIGFVSLLIGWSINAAAMVTDMNSDSVVLGTLLLLYGAAVGIWAFVDFIRILTGGLVPANGMGYKEDQPVMVQAVPAAPAQSAANDNLEALERLAKLHEQGILTDEEFQQKKKELLGKL